MAKNTKKTQKKYALNKFYYPKTKAELCDFDYLDKLSEKELRWLNTFMEEWAKARFNHGKRNLHKKKNRKEVYAANNARNRDLWTKYSKTDVAGLSPEAIMDYFVENADADFEELFIESLEKLKKDND